MKTQNKKNDEQFIHVTEYEARKSLYFAFTIAFVVLLGDFFSDILKEVYNFRFYYIIRILIPVSCFLIIDQYIKTHFEKRRKE